ncbi:MAG: hypothetical protein CMC18_04880 [Flavobacteriaceae bacterium]|nr:hypothetical protein [Flavobacteriaceae bacterium]
MMNKEQFLSILQNKKAPRNTAEINGLKELIKAYPYMQNAWALYLKSLDIDEVFEPTLKKTAIRTNDRSLLFDYINTKEEIKAEESPEQVKDSNNISEKQSNSTRELISEQEKKEEQSAKSFVTELLQKESAYDLSPGKESVEHEETETTPIEIPGQDISLGEEKNIFNTREEKLEIVENESILEEILTAEKLTEPPSEILIEGFAQTTEEEVKALDEEEAQTIDESHPIEDENQFNDDLNDDEENDDEDFDSKIRRLEVIISEMNFDEKEVNSEEVKKETSQVEIEADSVEKQQEESQDLKVKSELVSTVSQSSDDLQKENTTDQTHEEQLNYFEWIKQSSKNNVETSNTLETEEQERKYALLDAFLERNPKIVPSDEIKEIDIDSASSIEDSNLTTETIAQLYMSQKQFKKAVEAYKTLILKYPEKSSFFAIQIQEAQRLIDQQKDI